MSYASTRGKGIYHVGEGSVLMTPKVWRANGTVPGVIYMHGATNTEVQMLDGGPDSVRPVLAGLARAGLPVLGVYGAGDSWGNAACLTLMAEAISYLQTTVGAKAGPVVLTGGSMGGLAVQNYARANPTQVLCMVGMVPVSNLDDIRSQNRAGLSGSVDLAYPPSYLEATHGAQYNPHTYAAIGLAGINYRAYYSTEDPIVIPQTVIETVAAAGPLASAVPMVGAHEVVNLPADDAINYVMGFV